MDGSNSLESTLLGAFLGAVAAFATSVLASRVNARRRVAGIINACRDHVERERADIHADLETLQHASDALSGLIGALEDGSNAAALEDQATYQDALARAMNIHVNYFIPGRWSAMLGADVAFVDPKVFSAITTLESYIEFVNTNANQVLGSVRTVIDRLGHGSSVKTFGALQALNQREHGAVLALLRTHLVNVMLYRGLVAGLERHFEATARLLEPNGSTIKPVN